MKILIVAATNFEVLPLLNELPKLFEEVKEGLFRNKKDEIRVLITGVGMMHTAFALGNVLANYKADFAINMGIAGAFDRDLQIGDVVHVVAEFPADLGVEQADGSFQDVFEMGLVEQNQPPYINSRLYNPAISGFDFLPPVHAITVNKVHGNEESIQYIQQKYKADVETMEGAAFFHACLQMKVPFIQIRSISNYVESRNKDNWNIPLAIDNLNRVVGDVLETLLLN
jgi:futalosine hydrolase